MTENPYDSPSSDRLPTGKVRSYDGRPKRDTGFLVIGEKRAKWRIVLPVMFIVTLPLFRLPLIKFGRLLLNPIALFIAWLVGEGLPMRYNRSLAGLGMMFIVFCVVGIIEWFIYGWLLDTWLTRRYRRRLSREDEPDAIEHTNIFAPDENKDEKKGNVFLIIVAVLALWASS